MSVPRTYPKAVTIATDTGIMAALGGDAWRVFCAIIRSLPNMRPSRATITERSGVPVASINRHTRRMVRAGLLKRELRYQDGGGQLPTRYLLVDISDPDVVASILSKLAEPDTNEAPTTPEGVSAGAQGGISAGDTGGCAPAPFSPARRRSRNHASESCKTRGAQNGTGDCEQSSLPGITPPKAGGSDPSKATAYTFQTTDGPWPLTIGQRDKLREAYPFVHVDTQLAGLADWTQDNPGKRKPAKAMHGWLKRCLSREQAKYPLSSPARYDGYVRAEEPTDPSSIEEVDAILAESESEAAHV